MANTKVTSRVLANDAVLTANIADDQVTTAKIADDVALGGNPTTTTQSAGNNTTRIATTAFVTTAVANLADSAPDALNTLNELAAALGDDANFSTTVTNSIAAKLPLAGGTLTGDLTIPQYIIHSGDTDTFFGFPSANEIYFQAGNIRNLDLKAAEAVFNEGSADVDFRVESNSNTHMLFVDAGNDRVGIGTTPDFPLHVSSTGTVLGLNATSGAVSQRFNENGTARFFLSTLNGSNGLSFINGDGTSVRMLIDSSGNVGIGQAPNMKVNILHADQDGLRFNTANDAETFIDFGDTDDNDIGRISYDHADNSMSFRTNNSNDRVVIDSSGNVGIGTAIPSAPLHVDGAGMGDVYTGRIENSTTDTDHYNVVRFIQGASGSATGLIGTGGSSTGNVAFRNNFVVGTQSSHNFVLATADTERVRIDTSGNVGIGVTDPDGELHVESAGNADVYVERTSGAKIHLQAQSAFTAIGAASNHDLGLMTNASTRMRIDSSGKVGIGCVPAYNLDVVGTLRMQQSGSDLFSTIRGPLNRDLRIDINANGDTDGLVVRDLRDNSERFRVQADGNVGIGDPSPSYTLDVLASSGTAANFRGEGGPNGILIGGNDAGFGWLGSTAHANYDLAFNDSGYAHFGHGESTTFLYLGSQGGGWGGNSSHNLRASGTTFMFNSGSGNYLFEIGGVQKGYINASGFNNGSDVSLKENIEDISYGLETVKLLKPRKFDWKDAPADDKAEIGFVAQEVESIIPEIISESRSDGEGTSIKGMNYGALTSVLTKAIQEQQVLIEALQKKVEELKGG